MSGLKAEKGSLKDLDQRSREVFKPILENPFTQGPDYPSIPKDSANAILDHLVQLLPSYGNYLGLRNKKGVSVHPLHDNITIGFNSTVQVLESQAAVHRQKLLKRQNADTNKALQNGYFKYIFVAKNDISTPLLTSVFPLLAYTSSKSSSDRVKLIELPKGSMRRLSEVLQTKNVGIISISTEWEEGRDLFSLIEREVKDAEVPWLEGLFDGKLGMFEKPNVQFLKTKVPIGKRPGKKERRAKAENNKSQKEKGMADTKQGNNKKRKAEGPEGEGKKSKGNSDDHEEGEVWVDMADVLLQ